MTIMVTYTRVLTALDSWPQIFARPVRTFLPVSKILSWKFGSPRGKWTTTRGILLKSMLPFCSRIFSDGRPDQSAEPLLNRITCHTQNNAQQRHNTEAVLVEVPIVLTYNDG